MATILNFLILPTYDLNTIAIVDASTYDVPPVFAVVEVEVPGFGTISNIPLVTEGTTILNSIILEISVDIQPLPDGIYCFRFDVDDNIVEKRIMRTDKIQEKFDEAFMKLDMMECDRAIKTQSKVDLNTIYFFIQGSIASANNCATIESTKLYIQADKMLNNFIKTNCGCSGNNYLINFQ